MISKIKRLFKIELLLFKLVGYHKLSSLMILVILNAVLEIIGIAFIFSLMLSIFKIEQSFLQFKIVDEIFSKQYNEFFLTSLLLTFFILKIILHIFVTFKILDIRNTFADIFRGWIFSDILIDKIYRKVPSSGVIQYIQFSVGGYINGRLGPLLNIVRDIFIAAGPIIFLLLASGIIIIIPIFCLILFILIIKKFSSTILVKVGKSQMIASMNMSAYISKIQPLISVIFVRHDQEWFKDKFKKISLDHKKADINQQFFASVPKFILEFTVILLIIFGALTVNILKIDVYNYSEYIIMAVVVLLRLLGPSISLTQNLNAISVSVPRSKQLYKLFLLREKFIKKLKNYENYDLTKKNVDIKDMKIICEGGFLKFTNHTVKLSPFKVSGPGLFVINGPSGVGKSTLLSILTGEQTIKEARLFYLYHGKKYLPNDLANAGQIGLSPQFTSIIDENFEENIKFGNKEEINSRINKMFKNEILFTDKITGLSGGQLTRIGVARSIYKEKVNFVFLDEPLTGLDNKNKKEMISLILKLKTRYRVVVITHEGKLENHSDLILNLKPSYKMK